MLKGVFKQEDEKESLLFNTPSSVQQGIPIEDYKPKKGGYSTIEVNNSTTNNIVSTMNNMCSQIYGIFLGVLLVLGVILVIISIFNFSFIVSPGEIGIVVTLGHAAAYYPGLHYRIPYVSNLVKMSAKTQLLEQENLIPTKEGLAVTLDTAVLFRLNTTLAANLYTRVGKEYVDVLIKPEAASAIRGLTSESDAKALYTSGRNAIQNAVRDELEKKLTQKGIIIEDVLLKDIKLPDELTKSIELKAKAEQDSARMEFILTKEKQEAERKAIEAQGIADFQKIVSQGISAELLQWKGIEATMAFADSSNSKIIIVGNSQEGLPVILSADQKQD